MKYTETKVNTEELEQPQKREYKDIADVINDIKTEFIEEIGKITVKDINPIIITTNFNNNIDKLFRKYKKITEEKTKKFITEKYNCSDGDFLLIWNKTISEIKNPSKKELKIKDIKIDDNVLGENSIDISKTPEIIPEIEKQTDNDIVTYLKRNIKTIAGGTLMTGGAVAVISYIVLPEVAVIVLIGGAAAIIGGGYLIYSDRNKGEEHIKLTPAGEKYKAEQEKAKKDELINNINSDLQDKYMENYNNFCKWLDELQEKIIENTEKLLCL